MTDQPRISCIENSLLDTLVNIVRIVKITEILRIQFNDTIQI